MLTRMILNALQLSNFALNFFLYCTLNAQFRRAFVDWFCRRKRHRRDVRRAALGADAVGGGAPPRRRDDCVRLNHAMVRHQQRHEDVRTIQLRPGSVGGGSRSQRSTASDAGAPRNNSARPNGSNNAMPRLSGSRGSHLSSVHNRRSGSPVL